MQSPCQVTIKKYNKKFFLYIASLRRLLMFSVVERSSLKKELKILAELPFGHNSSHSNTGVKHHLAWMVLGWETLQKKKNYPLGWYRPLPPPPNVVGLKPALVLFRACGATYSKKSYNFIQFL
jgi:hypothetical protein